MFVRLSLCALLIGVAGIASAQNQPAQAQQKPAVQQLTPEQRAAIQKQNQVLVQYAESITAMIDNGQSGQVWDQASDVAKKSVSRDQFVKATESDRAKVGKLTSRKLEGVTRALSNGKEKLPEGLYVNVNFATQFSNESKPVRELVSFHLDSDKKWRLSGYTIR
ncbi:MAG: hypothetical protein OJF61_000685 [Rhodanobacteraceae bacterium]|jgi:hypothetical protein|nr:MAG: hypothetical protein OJF61_000685 [Rhodanobacteraceae bacterium]